MGVGFSPLLLQIEPIGSIPYIPLVWSVNNCHISQFYLRFSHFRVLEAPICLGALKGDWPRSGVDKRHIVADLQAAAKECQARTVQPQLERGCFSDSQPCVLTNLSHYSQSKSP
jgi:hypothetical protein